MTDLSPAAQAVLTAATQKVYCLDPEDVPISASEYGSVIAAALRVAADQVEQKWRGFSHEACQEIRAIADELEGL